MDNTFPNEIVKVLIVDTGKAVINTERLDLPTDNPADVKRKILEALNRFGKNSHALIHYRNKFFVADHTSKRGPSTDYYKREVTYHPYSKELV